MNRLSLTCVLPIVSFFACLSNSFSATVAYQGFLYGQGGLPVVNGRVVAGTFKPGFNTDTWSYWSTYGDAYANADGDSYYEVIADGSFTPLGQPVTTDATGFFQGVGDSLAIGQKIWIYGFTNEFLSDVDMVLASSSNASYVVPVAGQVLADAIFADTFMWGSHFNNGFKTEFGPIPEPAALGLIMFGIAGTCLMRRPSTAR